ncbi:MAG: uncharacterized protein JWP97_1173 [Labilithrix sp.]|nr:uncharacterized protein [Labilithrix sp.]
MVRAMRTATARPKQLRGERLVAVIIEAVLEEISTKGFEGLSIDDVAQRAGVNKTTIYRRWPTREDLARAALDQAADQLTERADTGSVRSDLVAFLRAFRDFATSPRGQTLMRMSLVESSSMQRLAREVRDEKECVPDDIVDRAIARGEVPRGVDAHLLFDTLVGAVHHRAMFGLRTDDRYLGQLIDLVIAGARGLGRPAARAPRTAKRRRP